MTREERAIEIFLRSVEKCCDRPAPTPRPEQEVACQGFARNRMLETANGR